MEDIQTVLMQRELLVFSAPAFPRLCPRQNRVADGSNNQLGEACPPCTAQTGIGDRTRRLPCTGLSLAPSRTFQPPGSLKQHHWLPGRVKFDKKFVVRRPAQTAALSVVTIDSRSWSLRKS